MFIPSDSTPLLPEISLDVRYAVLDDHCVIFNSLTGYYFTLSGAASQWWRRIDAGIGLDRDDSDVDVFLDWCLFYSLITMQTQVADVTSGAATPKPTVQLPNFAVHEEYESLLLKDPVIDTQLLGQVTRVNLANTTRRKLIEKAQVQAFIGELFREADQYSSQQKMQVIDISLGDHKVRINTPAEDSQFSISLRDAFFDANEELRVDPDFVLTVIDESLWSRRSSLNFDWDWHLPLGVVHPDRSGDNRIAIDRHTQSISVYSPRARKGVVWMPRYRDMPYWAAATPLRIQLSWIADSFDAEFLHTAAVKVHDSALLLAGPSGSGKSTLALRLSQLGYPLLADDFLLAKDHQVQAVYRRLKVHDWSAERVLDPEWKILNPFGHNEKRIIDPGNSLYSQSLPIGACVLPTVGHEVRLREISSGEAFSRLAPPSLSGLLGGNSDSLSRIAALIAEVPCFELIVAEKLLADSDQLLKIVSTVAHPIN